MIIEKLEEMLRKASADYYLNGDSDMTDDEYDAAVDYLRTVKPDSPFLQEIGPDAGNSNKVYHPIPMGTLTKIHTEEQVKSWMSKFSDVGDLGWMISPKYDGFAVELIYKDGNLVVASTRGTGYLGEDVTESIKLFDNIPKTVPTTDMVSIRGEVIAPVKYRDIFEAEGYVSLRNAVPGIVRSKAEKFIPYLHFVAYNMYGDYVEHMNYYDLVSLRMVMQGWGFEVEEFVTCEGEDPFSGLKSMYDGFVNGMVTVPYECDGCVLKVNRQDLTDDTLRPNKQIAWKFQSKVQVTTLTDVQYELGATGKYTPIAIFEPVVFQGATLTRASLGSYARMISLINDQGMKIGSLINVTRNGDIIPYVKSVVPYDGNGDQTPIVIPEVCPYCGEPLTSTQSTLLCTNKKCKGIIKMRASAYIRNVGVKGIGLGVIDKLVDAGYITCVSDAYRFDPDKVVGVKGWGPSLISKWKEFRSKNLPWRKILSIYPFENMADTFWDKVFSVRSINGLIYYLLGYGYLDLDDYFKDIKGIGEDRLKEAVHQIRDNYEDLNNIFKYMDHLH